MEKQFRSGLSIHFGILQVARNAGMNADVFDNEPAALAWLLLRPGT